MSEPTESEFLKIETYFIREKNVLFAAATFSELYVDYYLHLKDNRIQVDPRHDDLFKNALAGFALHCVSRPRNEVLAWTINIQDPLVNLFFGGDTETGTLTGRVFSENVKVDTENVFFQECVKGASPLHRSVVTFEGADMLAAIEGFYARSEQRPARLFRLDPETFAILSAHPDYDEEWFNQVNVDDLRVMNVTEDLHLLETRYVKWNCGCSIERILQALSPVWKQDPEGLFLDEETIEVNCPRCAAKHRVTRQMMDAWDQSQGTMEGDAPSSPLSPDDPR